MRPTDQLLERLILLYLKKPCKKNDTLGGEFLQVVYPNRHADGGCFHTVWFRLKNKIGTLLRYYLPQYCCKTVKAGRYCLKAFLKSFNNKQKLITLQILKKECLICYQRLYNTRFLF